MTPIKSFCAISDSPSIMETDNGKINEDMKTSMFECILGVFCEYNLVFFAVIV